MAIVIAVLSESRTDRLTQIKAARAGDRHFRARESENHCP
jgi:hypothetical protein